MPTKKRIVIGAAATLGALGGSFGLSGPLISATVGNNPKPAAVTVYVNSPDCEPTQASGDEKQVLIRPDR
jgi:hypothetical protein